MIVSNIEMKEGIASVMREQAREANRLSELTNKALGTLAFLRGVSIA